MKYMKTAVFIISLILLTFTFSACSSDQNNYKAGKEDKSVEAEDVSAAQTENQSSETISEEENSVRDFQGVSVPAKRENLTYKDRDNLLNALSETEKNRSSSEKYVKYLEEKLGVKNAGVEFFKLNDDTYLVEILLDPGSYIGIYEYGIYTEKNDKEAFITPAKFVSYEYHNVDEPYFVESSGTHARTKFDEKTKTFEVFTFFRGIGDCGIYYKYDLKTLKPVLTEARFSECADSMDPNRKIESWDKLDIKNIKIKNRQSDIYSDDKATVEQWLKTKPNLRITPDKEYPADSLKRFQAAGYSNSSPFYVSGDFDKNGKRDFAILLTYKDVSKAKKDRNRFFAIFNNADSPGKNPEPVFTYENLYDNDAIMKTKDKLYVAVPASDNGYYVTAKKNSYALEPLAGIDPDAL